MSTSRRVVVALVTFVMLGFATVVPAYAEAIQLLFPSELGSTNITALYPQPPFTVLAAPYSLNFGAATLTFATSNGAPFERRNQVPSAAGDWSGNFAPGTPLLWTAGANGPVDISFTIPVVEVGVRVQEDFYGFQAFTFTAFNDATPLGVFSVSGISTDLANNTALFLGVRATGSDVITRLQLRTRTNNFAISPVTFQPIPEPAAMLLFGTGLVGLAAAAVGVRRRRKLALGKALSSHGDQSL